MNGTVINSVQYAGTVSLSLQIDSNTKIPIAKINNAGTSALFNFFTDCLAGDFSLASAGRPTKIMLLSTQKDPVSGEVIGITSVSRFLYMLTNPEKLFTSETQGGSIKYSFIIPRALLDVANFDRIGLYADGATSPEDYSAYCDVSLSDENSPLWGSSSVMTLDWELNVSNVAKK